VDPPLVSCPSVATTGSTVTAATRLRFGSATPLLFDRARESFSALSDAYGELGKLGLAFFAVSDLARRASFRAAVEELPAEPTDVELEGALDPVRREYAREQVASRLAHEAPGDRFEQLTLAAVHLGSPGFIEFSGSRTVLEQIRRHLQDRHERARDDAHRDDTETRISRTEAMLVEDHLLQAELERHEREVNLASRVLGTPEALRIAATRLIALGDDALAAGTAFPEIPEWVAGA
jgi:hypothetical protein